MNVIEKTTEDGNVQYFEIISSKKELKSWFGLFDWSNDGTWYDDDTSVSFEMKDGSHINFFYGDKKRKINFANVSKMVCNGPNSTTIYGNIEIEYNLKYGDYEVTI